MNTIYKIPKFELGEDCLISKKTQCSSLENQTVQVHGILSCITIRSGEKAGPSSNYIKLFCRELSQDNKIPNYNALCKVMLGDSSHMPRLMILGAGSKVLPLPSLALLVSSSHTP